MKHSTGYILASLAVAAALAAGYQAGVRVADGAGRVAGKASQSEPARKLLYYRNPMGLPDTSPVPKKDPMGMDYIPVYEGEDEPSATAAGNRIKISADKVQKLGVKTSAVSLRELTRTVRAAGRIEADERRIYTIAPKFEGWIEKLHVNATGDRISAGQPLFEVYSPELISAQREYAIAAQGAAAMQDAAPEAQSGMKELALSSLMRLKNWDIGENDLRQLRTTGEAKRTLTYRSPVSGIVLDKPAFKGMRFMPGEMMYRVADLSTVWIIADVFEQDIGLIRAGLSTRVRINAYPEQEFEARIAYVYPTLNEPTRTVPVRLEIGNRAGLLRPGMFADVGLRAAGSRGRVLAVPDSAVIDGGISQTVLVELGEGRYESRNVRTGMRADGYIEVLEGVAEGEKVVVNANFLLDAESNLKAALSGFGKPEAAPEKPKPVVGHLAEGVLEEIGSDGTLSIAHQPIASLGWPAMTMDFEPANTALAKDIKPGSAITFEIVERKPGEWVVTRLQARKPQHEGH